MKLNPRSPYGKRRPIWPADQRIASEMLHRWSDAELQQHAERTSRLMAENGISRETAAWQAFKEITELRRLGAA